MFSVKVCHSAAHTWRRTSVSSLYVTEFDVQIRIADAVYCNDLLRALFVYSSVLNMLMYTCIHLYGADSILFEAVNCSTCLDMSHGIAQITSRLIWKKGAFNTCFCVSQYLSMCSALSLLFSFCAFCYKLSVSDSVFCLFLHLTRLSHSLFCCLCVTVYAHAYECVCVPAGVPGFCQAVDFQRS